MKRNISQFNPIPKLSPTLFLLVLIAVMSTTITSCSTIQGTYARLSYDFKVISDDERIRYEAGNQVVASTIAEQLDRYLNQIETAQYGNFRDTSRLKVYLFSDDKNYLKFTYNTGTTTLGGATTNEALILVPRIQARLATELCQINNCPETVEGILLHELSHIHTRQFLGSWHYVSKIPQWFHEGLATSVSNGAGAGMISADDAKKSILSGSHIIPHDSGRVFQRAETVGELRFRSFEFYRQSEMFVNFLKTKDITAFQKTLAEIRDRQVFRDAWIKNYSVTIADLWDEFVLNL